LIRAGRCDEARNNKTSKWTAISKSTENVNVPSPDPSPPQQAEILDTENLNTDTLNTDTLPSVNALGNEYCDDHLCGLCEGDCDVRACKCDCKCEKPRLVGQNCGTNRQRVSLTLSPCTTLLQNDDQCAGHLKCFQRNGGDEVPGCSGGKDSHSKTDYCYDPSFDVASATTLNVEDPELDMKGTEYCQPYRQCGLCEGDCDSDDDCAGELVCHQRGSNESVPGCRGGDDSSKFLPVEHILSPIFP